jgi:hypothetical protein
VRPGLAAVKARAMAWLTKQRMPVGAAIALLGGGIALGVLFATLAQQSVRKADTAIPSVTSAAQRAGVGIVLLDVAPWGEVFVDNHALGVSPPLTELELPAGPHVVEIRYADGKAATARVDVDPAHPSKIRHRFE